MTFNIKHDFCSNAYLQTPVYICIYACDYHVTQHTGLWVCSAYINGKTELNLLSLPEKLTNQVWNIIILLVVVSYIYYSV